MAKVKSKGTVLKQELAAVYTAVAQVISLGWDGAESETFESDTLDNASSGIPHDPTGRTEFGSITGEMFLDPNLGGHRDLTDLLTTPADQNWKITFANTQATEWAFTGAGFGMGCSVALNDGVKASFSIKVDGNITFPAGS